MCIFIIIHRELTELVEKKPSDQFQTEREETELTAHVSDSNKGAVTSKGLFKNVSNWSRKIDLAELGVVKKNSYERIPQEKVKSFNTNYPQRKKCGLIMLWTLLYLVAGASAEDGASLRCNPQLDPVGSIKHCVYLTTSPGVTDVRCYLDGAELPSSSNISNITVTRGVQTVGILDLYVTSSMDGSNISCRGDGGPESLPFSNRVTIHVAKLPDIDVAVEVVNSSLHITVILDRPIPYTTYSAAIFPGNVSFTISSLDSSYDVELLPTKCDQYYLVVYATNIAGQSRSEETRIFSRNLTILAVGIMTTAGSDMKTIWIETEQAVCEGIVDLKKNKMEQTYSLHGGNIIEFQAQDNQQLALEVGGNQLTIVTYDVQQTLLREANNVLSLHSEFAIASVARGAFYAIISVNNNTVRLDRSFYFVMNKTEAERGFTVEHLPRGTYLVHTYDIEKDSQILVRAPANVISVNVPGSPLRLPHRDKHCPLQLSDDDKIAVTCHCSPGLPLEFLIFTSHVPPAGTPEISLVNQSATCGETVMFNRPGDASNHYMVVLLYKEGETLILHQSYLNMPAQKSSPPVGVIVGVSLSVLLLAVVILGIVVGWWKRSCILSCMKKLSKKKSTAHSVLQGP